MKVFNLSLLLSFLFITQSIGQTISEGRVVYIKIATLVSPDLINVLDNDKLGPSASKMHLDWKKKLDYKLKDKLVEEVNAYCKENDIDIQPSGAISNISNGDAESYPNVLFPKKLLKKNESSVDIGEHFITVNMNLFKPTMPKFLKPWGIELNISMKVFDNDGNVVSKANEDLITSATIGGTKPTRDQELFSKIEESSADWLVEHFSEDIKVLVAQTFAELLK